MNFKLTKSSLNFKVYTSPTIPSSGAENDIVIISTTPMENWILSPDIPIGEPRNRGDVWIEYSVSGNVFDIMNQHDFMLAITRVYQYVGRTWVSVNARRYVGGVWDVVSSAFSATISITYPTNSTCTVTNSSGQTVASDTNTTSSPKTFTAIVGSKGTYTVTATATDGSGKSKEKKVEITNEGQFESVELSFSLNLLRGGVENSEVTGGLYYRKGTASGSGSENKITPSDGVLVCSPGGSYYNVLSSGNAFDVTGYKTLYVSVTLTGSAINYLQNIGLINKTTASSSLTNLNGYKQFAVSKKISTADYTGANMIAIDISTLSGEYKFAAGWCNDTGQTTAEFYDIYLE